MLDQDIEIEVYNSQDDKYHHLYVRKERLQAFYNFIAANRKPDASPNPMPGITWAAYKGLDAIFAREPKRFPVADILTWLEKNQQTYIGELTPSINLKELEDALERFSLTYPSDVGARV